MESRAFSLAQMVLFFLALLVLFLSPTYATVKTEAEYEFHTLPSGRKVPLAALRAHPGFSKSSSTSLSAKVYEFLPTSGHLSTQGLAPIALHAHTKETPLEYHNALRVSVNGHSLADEVKKEKLSGTVVRSGKGFSTVLVPGDDHPVAITLGDADLVPLHFADHPGVYVAAPEHEGAHGRSAASEAAPSMGDLSGAITVRQNTQGEELTEQPAEDEPGSPDMSGATHLSGAPKNETEASRIFEQSHIAAAALAEKTATRQSGGRPCWVFNARRWFEVAAAFDNTFCSKYGNDYRRAVAAIQVSLNSANSIFWNDLCVRSALVQVEAHCADRNDPYARTRGALLDVTLVNFRNIWRRSRGAVRRDVAILYVGFFAPETSIAIGYRDSSCSKWNGYGVTEGVAFRAVSFVLANAIGGATGGTQVGYRFGNSRRLNVATVNRIRNFLQFNGNSWCINRVRRFCNASCGGECVAGKCVTGVVVARRRSCAAAARPSRPIVCGFTSRLRYVTPWLDVIYDQAFVQYGRIVVDVDVSVGAIAIQVGARVGSAPTAFGNAITVRRGNSGRFTIELSRLLEPSPGQSCCWKRIFYTLRIGGCLAGSCGVIRKTYSFTLKCRQVCFGRTTLPMRSFRRCPSCV